MGTRPERTTGATRVLPVAVARYCLAAGDTATWPAVHRRAMADGVPVATGMPFALDVTVAPDDSALMDGWPLDDAITHYRSRNDHTPFGLDDLTDDANKHPHLAFRELASGNACALHVLIAAGALDNLARSHAIEDLTVGDFRGRGVDPADLGLAAGHQCGRAAVAPLVDGRSRDGEGESGEYSERYFLDHRDLL